MIEAIAEHQKRERQGEAGWLVAAIRAYFSRPVSVHRELRIIETLSLGGRRQLLLVACGGQRYLVGGSAESVETIVAVVGVNTSDEMRGESR